MRRHLSAFALMLLFGTSGAWAAIPSVLGTWTSAEPFVLSGSGAANAGWKATPGPNSKHTPGPQVVFDKQDGRTVSGYIAAPGGARTPLHGMIKSDGSAMVLRSKNGSVTADIKGDQMEWCFLSTAPKIDYVACNPLQRQAAK